MVDPERFDSSRYFLKDSIRQTIDFSWTDQNRKVPPPPLQKPFEPEARRIELPSRDSWQSIGASDVTDAIARRRSCRRFKRESLSLEELAYLLWATQGIRRMTQSGSAYRTVPSAGCRHALETYLCVLKVSELEIGIYRYLPVEHQLLFEFSEERLSDKIVAAAHGQSFIGKAPVTFIWTAIPYRMEWRYDLASHKVIAIDAGHVCQNLYLACSAVGAGTCGSGW
jgi:SagB-type dehydrogenase family enzyme